MFAFQVRNRLATFKNWPFSEEEGSDCSFWLLDASLSVHLQPESGDPLEADEVTILVRARGGDDENSLAGVQYRAGLKPLHAVGDQAHQHLAPQTVGLADRSDLQQSHGVGISR